MENGPQTQQSVEIPTTPTLKNAPDTSITASLPDAEHRSRSLLSRPQIPVSASGHPITDLWGSTCVLPPLTHQMPDLPQDLLDQHVEIPDKEKSIREIVLWMLHIGVCDCSEEEAAADAASPGGRKRQWCRAMEDLVEHATQCTAGNHCPGKQRNHCPVANCALTKGIFRHSETCTLECCYVCAPAKPFHRKTASRSAVDALSTEKAMLHVNTWLAPADSVPGEPRVAASLQRCIQSLMHATDCRDTSCPLPHCQKMKRVLAHTRTCKRKCNGECHICKMLIALCCNHAKECCESKCRVTFCRQIRQKWERDIVHCIARSSLHVGGDAPNPNQDVQSPQSSTGLEGASRHPPAMEMKGDSGPSCVLQQTLKVEHDVPRHAQFQMSQGKALEEEPGGNMGVEKPKPLILLPAAVNQQADVAPSQPLPQLMVEISVACQPLVEALNSPTSPAQQQRIASIMNGHPELIAELLRVARADNKLQAQQQYLRPDMLQHSQSMPLPGQGMNRILLQDRQAGQFEGEQAPMQQLIGNIYHPKQKGSFAAEGDAHSGAAAILHAKTWTAAETLKGSGEGCVVTSGINESSLDFHLSSGQHAVVGDDALKLHAPTQEVEQASSSQEARLLSIQRCIQSLMHAIQCRDAYCKRSSCQKMKRVLAHTKTCQRKSSGQCPICKQLIALCCYHAKGCNESKCFVPFCLQIRQKWERTRQEQDIQCQQSESRHAAIPHADLGGGDDPPSPNENVPSPLSTIRMEGESVNPPSALPETLESVHADAQFQVSQGKALGGKPGGKPDLILPPVGIPAPSAAANLQPSVAPGQPPPQQMVGSVAAAYQQLVETLNYAPSPEQHQRVADIMRGNPELIAGFLRIARAENNRQAQQQQHVGPPMPPQSQRLPLPGQDMNRMIFQGQQPGRFQSGQVPSVALGMGMACHPNQNATSGTHFDLETAGKTGTAAGVKGVTIPVNNTGYSAKTTYGGKTWISQQFRFRQDSSWQCKVSVCVTVFIIIAFVLYLFIGPAV